MSVAFDIVAGIGLFLLGIVLFMDSLRSIAGDALRRGLLRFAGTPMKAMLTGFVTTTFIQSAHATIVIAMGLAGAGILTGAQSIAILIGANIGTTGTAWLVAWLGLRIGFGPIAAVMVAAGAFTRILSKGKWGMLGQTVAGFGLLFVGIGRLADGMSGLQIGVDGVSAGGGVGGALALIGVGVLTTVVTQSSSVTVAATITAVFTGVLSLQDAAWLVIGQNLGTTSTLVIVSIGATAPGRRLALAHVIINGSTAVIVALAFRPLLWFVTTVIHGIGGDDALAVAGFHTVFNIVGALIWMPLLALLTARLHRWVPDKGPRLASILDPLTARVPGVGVDSARRAVAEIGAEMCSIIRSRLEHGLLPRGSQVRLENVERAMLRLNDFLSNVQSSPADAATRRRHMDVLHAVERLDHLIEACTRGRLRKTAIRSSELAATYDGFSHGLQTAKDWLKSDLMEHPAELLASLTVVEDRRHQDQDRVLETTAMGELVFPEAMNRLEAAAWITRQAHYLGRLIRLLAPQVEPEGDSHQGTKGDVSSPRG